MDVLYISGIHFINSLNEKSSSPAAKSRITLTNDRHGMGLNLFDLLHGVAQKYKTGSPRRGHPGKKS